MTQPIGSSKTNPPAPRNPAGAIMVTFNMGDMVKTSNMAAGDIILMLHRRQ
jgi:hypothetical protein